MKIYGLFDRNRKHEELLALVNKMGSQVNPDRYWKSNNYATKNLGVGTIYSEVTRQDKQPIWNETKTKFVIMAGKIFDYGKRKNELIAKGHTFEYPNSDAEFILHGIEEWGNNLLPALNGFFVFLFYDSEHMRIQIINDKCGMKPLYYFSSDDFITFASEVKAIIEDDRIEKKINWAGWRDFFSYGFMLGNKTPFKNIFSLPPATILTFTPSENVALESYWDYTQIKIDRDNSEQYFIDKGAELMRKAIQRQASNFDECVVFLSGGYDSRMIAGAMRYFTDTAFETYTTTPSLFLDSARSVASRLFHCLDPIIAKEVAMALKTKNTYVPRPPDLFRRYLIEKVFLLDGMCLEHLWIMPIVERLKGGKADFDGLSGDILLRGALITPEGLANINDAEKLAYSIDKQLRNYLGYPTEIIIDIFKSPIRDKLIPRIEMITKEIQVIGNHENAITIFHMKNRTKNSISLLPNNLIGKRSFCLFPFLDKDLVEFSLSIPPLMKISRKIYSCMLARMFPAIMKIPATTFLSPDSIHTWRKKYLFLLPLDLLIFLITTDSGSARKDLKHLLDILESLTIPECIDIDKAKEIMIEYQNRNKDPLPFLVPIVEFCIWYNLFIENKTVRELYENLNNRFSKNHSGIFSK